MSAGIDATRYKARRSFFEVLWVFLRLGCTSFGGPIAHLGYFRAEFVERRHWLDEAAYADLVALCQFLPGPASSQVGIGHRLAAGGSPRRARGVDRLHPALGDPLIAFAFGVGSSATCRSAWLHGLKIVAVAVVAQAVWGMARSLCPTGCVPASRSAPPCWRCGAAAAARSAPSSRAALPGWRCCPGGRAAAPLHIAVSRRTAIAALAPFFALLVGLPLLARRRRHAVALFDASIAPARWSSAAAMWCCRCCAGGGAAGLDRQRRLPRRLRRGAGGCPVRCSPSPPISARRWRPAPYGLVGGLLCLLAIYLPSFLLVIGVLPFWEGLRRRAPVQAALRGVNATRRRLLLAALYNPVWTSAISGRADFAHGPGGVPAAGDLEISALAGGGAGRARRHGSRGQPHKGRSGTP